MKTLEEFVRVAQQAAEDRAIDAAAAERCGCGHAAHVPSDCPECAPFAPCTFFRRTESGAIVR